MSPSSRGRGLKLKTFCSYKIRQQVALFTRAWIEIKSPFGGLGYCFVALFTRAWIEMTLSLSGFKYPSVALFTRAWIEITAS